MNPENISANERQAFSARLTEVMVRAGVPKSPTRLSRLYNNNTAGDEITVHAARKWMIGQAIPTQAKIQELAVLFNCEAQWLRFGEGPAQTENQEYTALERSHLKALRKLSLAETKVVHDLVASLLALKETSQRNQFVPPKGSHPYYCRCGSCV